MTKLINPIPMFSQDNPSVEPLLIITVSVEHPENNNNLEIPLLGKKRYCKTD